MTCFVVIIKPNYLLRRLNSFLVAMRLPPKTAGIPPPGWVDAPTIQSQGRKNDECFGVCSGPDCQIFLASP
jgi:hypothetical protein